MVRHTQKIKEIYEDIQKKLFYMIPEKWDKIFLYASVVDRLGNMQTGEMFFYYVPKGFIRRNPINVYEIPSKFNIEEEEYNKLVQILYESIKDLRAEFIKTEQKLWSNLTISIANCKFKIEYNYDKLQNSEFKNYERHVIWRYKYLGIGLETCSHEERSILRKYLDSNEKESKNEIYEVGLYINGVKNIVDFDTEEYKTTQNAEYAATKVEEKHTKNQLLL